MGLAGNMLNLLASADAIGSDLRLFISGTAGSTWLIRDLSLSGD
jgi:predicted Zn-dependent protease